MRGDHLDVECKGTLTMQFGTRAHARTLAGSHRRYGAAKHITHTHTRTYYPHAYACLHTHTRARTDILCARMCMHACTHTHTHARTYYVHACMLHMHGHAQFHMQVYARSGACTYSSLVTGTIAPCEVNVPFHRRRRRGRCHATT